MRKAVNMQQLIIKNIIFELIRFNIITPWTKNRFNRLFIIHYSSLCRTSFLFQKPVCPVIRATGQTDTVPSSRAINP